MPLFFLSYSPLKRTPAVRLHPTSIKPTNYKWETEGRGACWHAALRAIRFAKGQYDAVRSACCLSATTKTMRGAGRKVVKTVRGGVTYGTYERC